MLDPLLAKPDAVVPLAQYREQAARGRFGTLVRLPAKLDEAVLAATREGVLVIGESGITLSARACGDLDAIRSFVDRHYHARFGSRG